ncbi:unnamed protein product [Spirodela intermedia]|uniref:Uncharacterized protein n=2 Tax=Spirodela intermedia TaxID=51605 RepID=A0A7I8KR90_SPIIN|nr:unnamed protein product [Spirodela intermedia]CAA6663851.1 unnamed protein product [Spirodela intermedia]CAA7400349.1 unnamed protein product [Spirodela intermedia]
MEAGRRYNFRSREFTRNEKAV